MDTDLTGVKDRLIAFIKYLEIPIRTFEISCGFSNGFVRNISKGMGAEKLGRIEKIYPSLNPRWLLTGDGDMLRPSHQSVGDISESQLTGVNVHGSNIDINSPDENPVKTLESLVRIVDGYQRTTEKFQEQIDRLISLLEKRQG